MLKYFGGVMTISEFRKSPLLYLTIGLDDLRGLFQPILV